MEIILLKDLDKVGYKHDVVTVKNGYGRNFLIPQGVAVIANATNRKKLDGLIAEEAAKEEARVGEYQEMAKQLDGKTLKIGVKAGTTGKIFGSVTNVQIAAALEEQLGIAVSRKKVSIPEDVKELGTYTANVDFHTTVQSTVEFELIQE